MTHTDHPVSLSPVRPRTTSVAPDAWRAPEDVRRPVPGPTLEIPPQAPTPVLGRVAFVLALSAAIAGACAITTGSYVFGTRWEPGRSFGTSAMFDSLIPVRPVFVTIDVVLWVAAAGAVLAIVLGVRAIVQHRARTLGWVACLMPLLALVAYPILGVVGFIAGTAPLTGP